MMSRTLPGKRGWRHKGKRWPEASSGVLDQLMLSTMPPVWQRREPTGDALCEEGACGILHLSEDLHTVTRQLRNQQLNPRMLWITVQLSFK